MTWLTPKELAAELGIGPRKVIAMCKRGELRAVWVGRWRIHPDWRLLRR